MNLNRILRKPILRISNEQLILEAKELEKLCNEYHELFEAGNLIVDEEALKKNRMIDKWLNVFLDRVEESELPEKVKMKLGEDMEKVFELSDRHLDEVDEALDDLGNPEELAPY